MLWSKRYVYVHSNKARRESAAITSFRPRSPCSDGLRPYPSSCWFLGSWCSWLCDSLHPRWTSGLRGHGRSRHVFDTLTHPRRLRVLWDTALLSLPDLAMTPTSTTTSDLPDYCRSHRNKDRRSLSGLNTLHHPWACKVHYASPRWISCPRLLLGECASTNMQLPFCWLAERSPDILTGAGNRSTTVNDHTNKGSCISSDSTPKASALTARSQRGCSQVCFHTGGGRGDEHPIGPLFFLSASLFKRCHLLVEEG